MPSIRTLKKFARDLALAVVGFVAVYGGEHIADLGLDPTWTALLAGPLSVLAFRFGRQAAGKEPTE